MIILLFSVCSSRIIGSIPDSAIKSCFEENSPMKHSNYSSISSIIFCEQPLTYDIPSSMDFKCSHTAKYPKYYLYQHSSLRNDALSFDHGLFLSSSLALLLRDKFSSINTFLAPSTYILSNKEKVFENYTLIPLKGTSLAFLEDSSFKFYIYSNLSNPELSNVCKISRTPQIGIVITILLIVGALVLRHNRIPITDQNAKFWVFDSEDKIVFGGDFNALDDFTRSCIKESNFRARKSNNVVTQIIKINRQEINHHFIHIGSFPVNKLVVAALWTETFDDETKTEFVCKFSSPTHGLLKPPKVTFSSYRDYRPIHVSFTLDNNVRCKADLPAAAFSPFQPYGQLVCLVLSMYYELMLKMKQSTDGIIDMKSYVEKCFTRFKAKRVTIFTDATVVINLKSYDALDVDPKDLYKYIEKMKDHDFTYIHGAISPDTRIFVCKQKGFSFTYSFIIEIPETHPIDVYDDYAFPFFAVCTIYIAQSNFSAKQLRTFNNFFNAILQNENLHYVEFLLNKDIILSHSNTDYQKFTYMKDLLKHLNQHQYPHIIDCFNQLIKEDMAKQQLVRRIYKEGNPQQWYILSAASTYDTVQEDYVVTIFIEKMTQEKRQEHEMLSSFKSIERDFAKSKIYKFRIHENRVYVIGNEFLEFISPEGKIETKSDNEEVDIAPYLDQVEKSKLSKIILGERVSLTIKGHSFITSSNEGIGFLVCTDNFPDIASNQPDDLPFPSATSSVVFWIVDTQTEKVSSIFMQPTILDVIGLSHDTKFPSLSTCIHQDDRETFSRGYNDLIQRHTTQFNCEIRIMRAGGDYEWHRLALALSGNTLHCLAMNTNKQREVEFKLRETRQLRDLLLSSGKLSLWTFRDNNEPAEKMKGFVPGVVSGIEMNWTFIKQQVPEDYRQTIATEIEKALDTGTTIEIDFPIDIENNDLVWVSVRGKGDTSLRQVVGVCIDVTELRNAYNRLETERARAEEANKQKTLFLANMSHEIRTPMNGIFGMLDVLSLQELTSEQRLLVDSIRSSSFQLMKLLDDTLHLSKIEQGETEVEMANVDIWQLIAPTILANYASAKENNVKLSLYVKSPFPSLVRADPQLILKILNNLLSNAIKFTKQGRIDVKLSFEDEIFTLSVADTGIGISKDQRAVIFERFAQADDCVARFFGGTGLGLSLVQEIAKFLGGDVTLESEVGRGSTFTVTIPMESIMYPFAPSLKERKSVLVYSDDEDTVKMLKEWFDLLKYDYVILDDPENFADKITQTTIAYFLETSRPMKQIKDAAARIGKVTVCAISDPGETCVFRNSIPRPVMFHHVRKFLDDIRRGIETSVVTAQMEQTTPLKILVVEDNKANQFVMKKILQNLQCSFKIAENGSEALTALDNDEFDIVFMDCQMPVLDGLEATRRIRASGKEYRNVPIVALTASAVEGDEQVCMDAGMDAYLAKPVRMQQISALIKRFSSH